VEVHLLQKGEDPGEAARRSGAGILGMAGGNGSLAAVASTALATEAGFVCVPFGTRNHFARDVGLDGDDPFAALGAFTDATGAPHVRVDGENVDPRVLGVGNRPGALRLLVPQRAGESGTIGGVMHDKDEE
jgi:diacylglycerol kinase family enzyme